MGFANLDRFGSRHPPLAHDDSLTRGDFCAAKLIKSATSLQSRDILPQKAKTGLSGDPVIAKIGKAGLKHG
jgi:hypothetical protein